MSSKMAAGGREINKPSKVINRMTATKKGGKIKKKEEEQCDCLIRSKITSDLRDPHEGEDPKI